MRLLDTEICKGILQITTRILRDYFFYDTECLGQFIDKFIEKVGIQYSKLEKESCPEIIDFLKYDPLGKKQFTCYFVSYHLHDLLVDELFFTKKELKMFDNILPKLIGVQDVYAEQRHKRAHY